MILIDAVSKRFGAVAAVDDVTLEVRENEFFALLGPSGCGKTTLLRMLAGFETPDSGRLLLDGDDLVGVKPYKRPLNMMFQSYALFPHMSVLDNVAYGLRMEGVRKDDARGRAADALQRVGLGGGGAGA
ncbi:MAG TPA: ATP-binding cassette domain-containing protein, partial [Baekduia sp.]|nr:ATP-binding cassette domain-containing protein [Baekduia sp.]